MESISISADLMSSAAWLFIKSLSTLYLSIATLQNYLWIYPLLAGKGVLIEITWLNLKSQYNGVVKVIGCVNGRTH